MSFFSRNKLLAVVIVYLIVVLVALPLTLINLRQQQTSQSSAAASTTLSFSPATIQKDSGDTFPLDIMIDPGQNAVSFITLDIGFDPSKVTLADTNPFQVNTLLLSVVEGPVIEPGRLRVKVAIGSDATKAITTLTKVGSLSFVAVAPTGGNASLVEHGPASYVLSIATDDNATDNVLATKNSASITIGGIGPTTDPNATPTGIGGPTGTPPTFPPTIPPTTVPTPSCTPIPPGCAIEGANCTPPVNGYCTDEPTPTISSEPLPTDPPVACQQIKPADVAIILDRSSSMRGGKIGNAKQSAKSFIEVLQKEQQNRVSLITFAKTAAVTVPLTNNYASIDTAINAITLEDWTCTKCALEAADGELAASGRPDAKKVIVLLTDGKANTGGAGGNGTTPDKIQQAEQAAIQTLTNARTQDLLVYAIGIGNDVNPSFLQQLAQIGGGAYYFASSPIEINDQFTSVYTSLNTTICNGDSIAATITSLPITPSSNGGNVANPIALIIIALLLIPTLILLEHIFT